MGHLLTKKYHLPPEGLTARLKGLSSEDLLELGERILECDSFEEIQRWLRQKKGTHSGWQICQPCRLTERMPDLSVRSF